MTCILAILLAALAYLLGEETRRETVALLSVGERCERRRATLRRCALVMHVVACSIVGIVIAVALSMVARDA